MTARIYDKTAEMAKKGNEYWNEIWGARRDPQLPVWRLEFEMNRDVLRSFDLDSPEEVFAARGDLWAYATTKWLSLRTPTGDATRARWPVAHQWVDLQGVTFTSAMLGLERMQELRGHADLERVLPYLFGYLTTYGSLIGAADLPAVIAQLPDVVARYGRRRGTTFTRAVHEKRRVRSWS